MESTTILICIFFIVAITSITAISIKHLLNTISRQVNLLGQIMLFDDDEMDIARKSVQDVRKSSHYERH